MKDNKHSPTSVTENHFFPEENTNVAPKTNLLRFFKFNSYLKAVDNLIDPELAFNMSMALHNLKNAEDMIGLIERIDPNKAKEILNNYYKGCFESFDVTDQKLIFLNSHGINTDEYCKEVFTLSMEENDLRSASELISFVKKQKNNDDFALEMLNNYFDSHKEDYKDLNNSNTLTGDKLLFLSKNGVDIDQYCKEVFTLSMEENERESANDMLKFLKEHNKGNLAQEIENEHKLKIAQKELFCDLMAKNNFDGVRALIMDLDQKDKDSLITNYMKDAISYKTLPLEMDRAKFLIRDLGYDPYKKYVNNNQSVFELAEREESFQTLTLINNILHEGKNEKIVNRVKSSAVKKELITDISQANISESLTRAKRTMEEKVRNITS